jgi:DNA-binding transcriptional LysR family regulator
VRATGSGIHSEPLLDEETLLMASKSHPECARRLSRRRLSGLRHVGVEMAPGRGFRDLVATAYARAGIERNVSITVPTFAAAAAVAATTDLVATLPASLFEGHGTQLGLRAVQGPVPVHTVAMALCWHERTHTDPALSAFRGLVRRAIMRGAAQAGTIR